MKGSRARRLAAVVTALVVTTASISGTAAGQEEPPVAFHGRVELIPHDGTSLWWDTHRYAGALRIDGRRDGLVLVERLDPETYLLGIREVPLSWPEESLKAQVVAARTYLAWTLSRGRAGAGRTYGFDICASAACQVYDGLDQVDGPGGDRWEAAVAGTAGEMLLYEGLPAQALYSSTSGGRTRSVQDVYPSSSPLPYLQAVASPDEESPFVDWSFELRNDQLAAVLRRAGLAEGELRDVTVAVTADGAGPWRVDIDSDGGTRSLSTWEFRGEMNRAGPRVYPELLPGVRANGRRYPQVILSPTYDISREWRFPSAFRSGHIDVDLVYRVEGHGWGHLVGMSQYGSKAMADGGSAYQDILAHYYGGLRPQQAPQHLPADFTVGLSWGEESFAISPDGPVTVIADGRVLAEEALGTWTFRHSGSDVAVIPPQGLGLPPTLRDVPRLVEVPAGRAVVVTATLSAAAEVRLVVFRGTAPVGATPWAVRDVGRVGLVWDATVAGETAPPAPYRVLIQARSSAGTAAEVLTVLVTPRLD